MAPATGGISDAAIEWLSQMKSLKESLDQLKLSHFNGSGFSYGKDIVVEPASSTEPSSGDDVWDYLTDEEDEDDSSDGLQDVKDPVSSDSREALVYSIDWLSQRCDYLAAKTAGLSAQELHEQVSALLGSDLHSKSPFPYLLH